MEQKIIDNILQENLGGLLRSEEIGEISKKMSVSWNAITEEWSKVTLDNLAKDEHEKRIRRLSNHFSIYLTEKVKTEIIQSNYEVCFGHIRPPGSGAPFIGIVAGAIASGKSTVANCVFPSKYGSNFGMVNKDTIKASTIFRELINSEFGEENGNLIRDYMLQLRNFIVSLAIENNKSIMLEQSCKTRDFLDTCAYAKKNNYKVYAEIVITPIEFACLRNVYRYVMGLLEDKIKGTNYARYEAYANIEETYANAPYILEELNALANDTTVYSSDLLETDITGKTLTQVFHEIQKGPVSDISYEIAVRMLNFTRENMERVKESRDISKQLDIAEKRLVQLANNPGLIYKAVPQKWQTPNIKNQIDRLNVPLNFSYSGRLDEKIT